MAEGGTPDTKRELQVKHDWYQTETAVVITVLVKNLQKDDLKVEFSKRKVTVNLRVPEYEETSVNFNLAHEIVPEQCSYKLGTTKIEIKLQKSVALRWEKLEGLIVEDEVIKPIPSAAISEAQGPPSYPTSKKGKDWSAIEKDIKQQEAQEKPEGEEALNKLFQEIYGKGSDEVKKAMNKSYMESGGTVLSTNWKEIASQKTDVKPPDGTEFRKWND